MRRLFFNFSLSFMCIYAWAQKKQPNIVFILADDLGIGDIEPYGQKYIKTPNINQLANEGMTFVNFYAGSTVCAPSRASLFTGQHTGHTKIRGNGEYPLDAEKQIFTQGLKKLGYHTGFFGKWGLGLKGSDSTPNQKGIDEFAGFLHHVDAHFQQPDSIDIFQNKSLGKLALNGQYANDYFVNRAISFIKNSTEIPFFLFVSLTIPHAELKLPKRFMLNQLKLDGTSKYPDEKAHSKAHYGAQKYPRAAYAGLVESIDAYTGYILDAIQSKGIDENTIIIFSSDNGTHVEGGRRMEDVHFFESSSIYRGIKRDLYTGGIKEPFIVRWPGKIQAHTTNDFTGAFWDLYPTFIELAGGTLANDDAIDGISLKNTLLGKPQKPHEYLYWEFHEFGGKQALLKGDWKAIRLNVNKERFGEIELYNIAEDPAEKINLTEKFPDKTKEMTKLLDNIRTENETFNFKD